MKKGLFVLVCACLLVQNSFSQARLVNVKPKQFKISTGLKIQGSVGFLEVPENRKTVDSRKIQLKFVHLKSLSDQPSAPVIYLEGGGGLSTWEASSPSDLQDRLPLLKEADLIFLDRRGASDKKLTYLWKGDYPADFFASESTANQHYQKLAEAALEKFEQDKIDIFGYNVLAHAEDVNDLVTLLGLERFSIFGFSYGSHIGMTVMDLYPDLIERAILVGPDAPHQAFNYPSHLDAHIKKIGALVEEDPNLDMSAVEFSELVENVIKKLEESPAMVSVKHPQTKKKMDLSVGGFGLALILRLDIDDANDIPVIPRLLHSINTGDYAMLKWFLQKRMAWAVQFPGQGINQQIASGSSELRWSKIKKEAEESLFGNVVNFPFSALK
ncbi:MAG: alpha/beta fold hydrolase [Bacteroidota bacterium]